MANTACDSEGRVKKTTELEEVLVVGVKLAKSRDGGSRYTESLETKPEVVVRERRKSCSKVEEKYDRAAIRVVGGAKSSGFDVYDVLKNLAATDEPTLRRMGPIADVGVEFGAPHSSEQFGNGVAT